jgi:hypothetical protein
MKKIIIFIIVLIIIVVLIYYFFFRKKPYHTTLFEGPQLLTLNYNKEINFNRMKPSTSGLKYTYTFWLYTYNMSESGYWLSSFDKPKSIIRHYLSPDIYYLPNSNTIQISIGYKNNDGKLSGYNLDLKNFKYQTWQQVAVIVDNRIVSVYVNGVLSSAANLPNVPWIANRMLYIGEDNNNFNGYIWNLEYYNDALSGNDIFKKYNKTKPPKLNNSFFNSFKHQQKQK